MEKFKSRKFLTMLFTNIVMLVLSALSLQLDPAQYEGLERVIALVGPILIGGLTSFGYISAEGKADAMGALAKVLAEVGPSKLALPPEVGVTGAGVATAVSGAERELARLREGAHVADLGKSFAP